MSKKETPWYALIGKSDSPQLLVQCESFANALSLEEAAPVEIFCAVPIVKLLWEVCGRDNQPVLSGIRDFSPNGTERFTVGEQIPLERLRPYETESVDYYLKTTVTLASGHEVSSPFSFRVWLHSGKTATEAPAENLRARLAALPIADSSMTGAQLRQLCLDYMRLQLEFPYRMKEDFVYTIESQRRTRRLLGGKVYGGIPYVSRGAGNLYRIAEIYDPETGYLDTDSDVCGNIRVFGNACSGATSMSWARAVSSAYLGYTMFMTEANGFLPVGPFRYPVEGLPRFRVGDICCRSICDFNGEAVMYASYAALQPADGIVCDSHVRMISQEPVVVRSEDGSIDPDESYVLTMEQNCYVGAPVTLRLLPDGSHYTTQGFVNSRYSFRALFNGAYLPFTFREFADPTRVEPARILLAVEPELKDRVLSSNYPISDVFAERDGRRWVYRNMEFFRKELKLGDILPPEALAPDTKFLCQLLNGQLLEVKP